MQQNIFGNVEAENQSAPNTTVDTTSGAPPAATSACSTLVAAGETATGQDFESMLSQLEKIVGQLDGELKLEEALALFEQGLGLSQQCEKFLKGAEQKIELLKRTASGIQTEPFEADD